MTNDEAKELLADIKGNIIVRAYSQYVEAIDIAIKALEIVQGIEDAYMRELLKTPLERGVPISDPCDGCRYELNSTNGNPCYSCGKYKLTEQQPKTAHWIAMDEGFTPYECSECGSVEFKQSKYCPNCGARMAESEEKE